MPSPPPPVPRYPRFILPPHRALALALDPSLILDAAGLAANPWQRDVLLAPDHRLLLNCSRQAGKSTVVSALALHTALFRPDNLILLLSKSQRQSHELFRKVLAAYNACGRPVPTVQDAQTMSKVELANGSRIVGLPGNEATIRSFSKVALLVIDEAARVPDDLYGAVRPMLAVSDGRFVALSTPFGQRGFLHREWRHGTGFKKVLVPWTMCPRITPEFIAGEEEIYLSDALNDGGLPEGFYVAAEQHAGLKVADVLTLHRSEPPVKQTKTLVPSVRGGRRSLSVRHVSGNRIVALIEIVSPGNKSSKQTVREFVRKAREALRTGVHVTLIDLFPPGTHDPGRDGRGGRGGADRGERGAAGASADVRLVQGDPAAGRVRRSP